MALTNWVEIGARGRAEGRADPLTVDPVANSRTSMVLSVVHHKHGVLRVGDPRLQRLDET